MSSAKKAPHPEHDVGLWQKMCIVFREKFIEGSKPVQAKLQKIIDEGKGQDLSFQQSNAKATEMVELVLGTDGRTFIFTIGGTALALGAGVGFLKSLDKGIVVSLKNVGLGLTAFAVATGFTAGWSYLGIKYGFKYLGVNTVQEYGHKMRELVPIQSAKIKSVVDKIGITQLSPNLIPEPTDFNEDDQDDILSIPKMEHSK